MALNFLGLGFSFGAKDQGLVKFQEKLTSGFFQITESLNRVSSVSEAGFGKLETSMMQLNASLDIIAQHFRGVEEVSEQVTSSVGDHALTLSESMEQSIGQGLDAMGDQFERMGMGAGEDIAKWSNALDKAVAGVGAGKTALMNLGKASLGVSKSFNIGVFDTLKKTGFFFGRRAKDIRKGQEVIAGGFGEIKEVVRKLNQILKVNKLQGLISAISLGTLGKISGALGGLGSEGMNLTTSLEAMGVANEKSAKQTAVNLGLTGKEMKKVSAQASSMAISLNIGAEQATQSIVAFNRQAELMGAVGIKSASDLAKLSEVTGLNAKAFGEQLQQMKSLGLASEDINGVVASFTSMGQATRDVGGALSSLPEMLKNIQTKSALMGRELDPKQLAAFARQTASLAAGLGKFGLSADEARSISMGLADAQVGAQKEFANLFAGVGEGLPSFMKELAIFGGDFDSAMDLMSQGPAGLVEGLDQVVKNAEKSGADMDQVMNFLRARLEKAGIANADVLVNFLAKGSEEAKGQMKITEKATESVAKLGKEGFSTGRTLAESFDLAKESAIAHFRASGKASKTFLKDFTDSASKFNKILDETSKDGGPLGQFVDKLRDVHRLGAAGLLPKEMQGAGILLGEIVRQLGPMLGLIGGAILFFPGLTAVLGPVVSILGLFAINLFKAKLAGEDWSTAFQTAFNETGKTLRKGIDFMVMAFHKLVEVAPAVLSTIGNALVDIFNSIDWSKVGTTLLEGGKKALGFLLEGFLSAQGKVNEVLGGIDFKEVFSTIFGKLGELANQIPVDKIVNFVKQLGEILIERAGILADALMELLRAALPMLAPMIGELATGIADLVMTMLPVIRDGLTMLLGKLTTIADDLGPILSDAVQKLVPFLLDALGTLFVEGVPFIWKSIPVLVNALLGLAIGLIGLIQTVFVGLLKGIRDWIVQYFPSAAYILDPLIGFIDGAYEAFRSVLKTIQKVLVKALDIYYKFFAKLFTAIFKDGSKTWTSLKRIVLGVWESIRSAWNRATSFFEGIGAGIYKSIAGTFNRILSKVSGVWASIKSTWEGASTFFVGLFDTVWEGVQEPFNKLKGIVLGVWDDIKAEWGKAQGFFGNLWSNIKQAVVASVRKIGESLDEAIGPLSGLFSSIDGWVDKLFRHSIHDDIENDMAMSVDAIDGMGSRSIAVLKQMNEGIFGVFQKSFDMLQKKTETFVQSEMKHFKDFLSQLQQSFASAFLAIANHAQSLTTILSEDIGATVAQLTQIKQAFQHLEAARTRAARASEEAVREKAETVPMQIPPELQGLAKAVNWPSWYTDSKNGMRKVLEQEFSMLRSQLNSLEPSAAASTPAGSAKQRSQSRADALLRLRRSADGTTSTSGTQ